MKTISISAIAASALLLLASPSSAATLSALNANVVKFGTNTPEADLKNAGVASITFGNTTIYIGTNQVSANDQNPIVTSFTNGIRDWVQSYDTSAVDARGVGLLWDEASSNLYGVFTADGGATGSNTFSNFTQNGWLPSYGRGGGAKASVLLKLNPASGAAEAGTYLRAELSNGNTNTLDPTGLDYVDGKVVFFGNSFFTPLDVNGDRLTNPTPGLSSPFQYRVVLSNDLTTALQAEAIGWNGVTAFSPLTNPPPEDTSNPNTPPPGNTPPNPTPENPSGETPGNDEATPGENPAPNPQPVPEPGLVLGLIGVAGLLTWQRSRSQRAEPSSLG